MGLSVVQASDMAMTITMSSDMGAMADSDCKSCPGGDDEGPASCPPICTAPGLAMVPENAAVDAAPGSKRVALVPSSFPVGRMGLPDPYPPRSSDLV